MGGKNIEYLKPLRKHIAKQLFGMLILVIILAVSLGILVTALASTVIGVSAAIAAALLASSLLTVKFSGDAMIGTEFLAKALLYVSPNPVGVAAPDAKLLPASREFLAELAKNIYDMASSNYVKKTIPDSEQKVLNEMHDNLLKNIPVSIFVINDRDELVYINEAAERYSNIDSRQALNKPFYDFVKLTFDTKQTLESWIKESKSKVATNTQSWDRVKLNLADGKARYCDMSARFNKDNPSGVETVIALLDHTDKYLNEEHGIGTISMAVHELRTPITAMRGYIEVFEDEVAPSLNSEQAQYMRALSAQAQQLGSFINNVQNFAKIEENSMSLSLKSEDWGNIVATVIKDMALRAQVRKKQVLAEIPDNLPPVAVDKSTIYEVLVNLIENAIKYTHSSEPIKVSCRLVDDKFIETTITDNGIGIPASLLGNLFERFYRSHRSSASVGGMGLGLYLSKSIVTAHGGEIWVKSVEGKGSTFGFTIPTFDSIASNKQTDNNSTIVRSAHGWIKNHNLYRG